MTDVTTMTPAEWRETAAIRACLELGGNGYVMGPYKADWTPTQRHTEEP